MLLRLGYQISCNLHNNVLIRSASVGSSRRFRCLSPSCLYGQLKDNVIPNANFAAAFSRQRSRPPRLSSESFKISSLIKTFRNYPTYRNFSQIQQDDGQEAAEALLNNSTSKPYLNIVRIRKGPVTHKLQPKNINPVATVNINLNSFVPFEEKPPHSEKFVILRKQAHSQYLKAVRNLNKKEEDFSYRYKLETANPKAPSESAFNASDVRRKLQHVVHNIVPQLQPKNIKPFGNITNAQWRTPPPNIERVKQGYVVYQTQNEKSDTNENIVAVKKGDSDRDVSKNLLPIQHREYCTAQGVNHTDKCNNIKTDYKRINSNFTENESFSTFINPESKQPVENNATQVVDEPPQIGEYKSQNSRYMLYMSGGSVYSKRISEKPNSTIYKNNFKPLNENTIFHRSKTSIRPITVKIGPKWKLQSTGGPDIVESMGPLNPGANEKFVVPWPSYSERIKTSKTPRLPKPLTTSITDVDEASSFLKGKHDAMYNKIQSDTNALFLKPPQNILPELSSSKKQSMSVLSREYSTGLRQSDVGKEQRGFSKMRKTSNFQQVLSKISDIQEKRYSSYKGSLMKSLPKNKMKSKLKQLSLSEVPQLRMNVPISGLTINPPIIHHVSKAIKPKLSRETLFKRIRDKLKFQAGNQSGPQRSDMLIKPYGGYMFSRQRTLNSVSGKVPIMMFSTLTRMKPSRQDISINRSVYLRKTCCPSRVDESHRMLRSYLRPLNVPDYPQVCDEGLLSQLKSNVNNPLSKQNLNSMYSFKRSLSNLEESKANYANMFQSIWAKVTEYFTFLNIFKVPRVCFECGSEARDLQGGFLSTSNFLSSGKKCSANCSRTTGLYSIPSRNYSLFDKFEARRKRRKEPCPCVRKKLSNVLPLLKRLPKHPPMDRPTCKYELLQCDDLSSYRADMTAPRKPERKSLPKLVVSNCPYPEKPKSNVLQPKLKRLPKIKYKDLLICDPIKCVDEAKFRADRDLKVEKKTLPVLVPGKLPAFEKQPPKRLLALLKRLPKPPFIDRPPYKCEEPCMDLRLFKADILASFTVKPKKLPKLEFGDCPCPALKKNDTPQPKFKRLPKPPLEDHVWECREVNECAESEKYRADRGLDFSKKKSLPTLVPGKCPPEEGFFCPPESKGKITPPIFKNNNRKFSTMANRFETVHEYRCFSTKSHTGNEPKECKKLGKTKVKKQQCKRLTLFTCEPAKSISCKRKLKGVPCKKTNAPYPAFSECKNEDDVPPLTECDNIQKHLQPRWPLINDIEVLEPPPPRQGKIDPSKEEQCVIRKLNITRNGTKTCEDFYAPEKSFNAKEMLAKHKEEEGEDDDGEECGGSSEYTLTPDTNPQEEKIPPKEDICVKRSKPKSADLCGVNLKPSEKASPSSEQEKPTAKAVCSLPKHGKPCQAPVKEIKSQDPPKLTAKDICDLTKKKVAPKARKKSSIFGLSTKSKVKKVSKKKVPVKVTAPPKGFFRRILEFFFGKPRRAKPLLSEKPKKVSSVSKLCRKGTSVKTKPVFCYSKGSSAAKKKPKKKPKKKDISNTSKSNAKPSKGRKPSKKSEPLEESKESKIKEPSHKILDVTKAALCVDEREKEKSKIKAEKVTLEKEIKKSTHKITELTKALPCPDEHEAPKKSPDIKKPKHKIAGVTQVALCPDELEGGEILDEGGEEKVGGDKAKSRTDSGRCRIPSYKNCPPKARESCGTSKDRPPCKAKEPPYSSFSECHKNFPKLPINECTEQHKRLAQQEAELNALNEESKKKSITDD